MRACTNLQLLQSSCFMVGFASGPGQLLQLLLKLLHLLRQVLGGRRLLRAAPLLLLLAHLGQGALGLALHTLYQIIHICTFCHIRYTRRTALWNASLLRWRSNCTISSEASTAASSCSIFCCISCILFPPPPTPMMDMGTGLERLAWLVCIFSEEGVRRCVCASHLPSSPSPSISLMVGGMPAG